MKYLATAAIAVAALGSVDAQQNQPRCQSIYTRPELLSMSSGQWGLTRAVLTAMQRDGWFAWFAYLHQTNFNRIHGNSQFFPFHRRFVYEWESVGRQYHSGFVQPYWDEMRDYRNPASSQVLTSNWVGGNGQGSDRCVRDGLQGGWTMTYPNRHCFQRSFSNNGQMSSWYSPEYIQSFIQRDNDMTKFRPDIEYSIHGVVHIQVGGDMAQAWSPNDWIFMMHHANIDRMWWQWQMNGHLWTMDGPNYDNSETTLDTTMPHFNEPIRSVMQLGYGKMCYQYASNPIRRRGLIGDLEQTLAHVLPTDVLKTWFPGTAKKEQNGSNHAPGPALLAAMPDGKPLPRPPKLTEDWIKMHGFNPADVNKVYEDAKGFVNAMNKAGYKS